MSEALYREGEFVERCFCEEPAPLRCACCHQPRCAQHLEAKLCSRCTQAVGRYMRRRVGKAWLIGGASGVVAALVLMPFVSSAAIFIGLGMAVGAGVNTLRFSRSHAIHTLGRQIPLRGELPAEAREPTGERGSDTGMPPGGYV